MATYWENSCSFGFRYVSWYKCLIVGLVFSHLGFWSGNLFLIAPFPDLCLLVPFHAHNWERNGIKLDSQPKVYKVVLLPIKPFEKVVKIKWQDIITDLEVQSSI